MALLDLPADRRDLQVIVKLLQKKIPDVKGHLFAGGNRNKGTERDHDFCLGFLFLDRQLGCSVFGPLIGILTMILVFDFFFSAQFLDDFSRSPADRADDIEAGSFLVTFLVTRIAASPYLVMATY